MTIVEQLKEYMTTNNLTQDKLARELGCQLGSLNQWLKGHRAPSPAWTKLIEIHLKGKL